MTHRTTQVLQTRAQESRRLCSPALRKSTASHGRFVSALSRLQLASLTAKRL